MTFPRPAAPPELESTTVVQIRASNAVGGPWDLRFRNAQGAIIELFDLSYQDTLDALNTHVGTGLFGLMASSSLYEGKWMSAG